VRVLYHHRIRGIDGQGVHVRALLQALLCEGHEVREVALAPVFEAADTARAALAPAAVRSQRPRRPWSWIDALPQPLLELAEYAYSPLGRRMIVRAAASFHPDVVYERYAFGNAAGVLAARGLRIPLVLEVNAPLVDEMAHTRGVYFPSLARRVEGFVLAHADLVCVVSEALRAIAVDHGARAERVLVVPNAVDVEAFPPPTPERRDAARQRLGLANGSGDAELVLGFCGFPRAWHRLDLVLECLRRPRLARTRLVVVGEGPELPWLERRAAELGLADRVSLVGTRRHDEIPELLAAFDIAVLAGIPPYASPLKLHEYLAAGLPVVAPDQDNLRKVLEQRGNALLFAPGSVEALAVALTELCGDAALRERLGARARESMLRGDKTWRGVARQVMARASALVGS
jgi:glycosyltransferase involved in cell wall biosynthesis